MKHPWEPEWKTLLHWLHGQVDPSWTVVVLTDRGLYARWLFQAIVDLGWHPMMRITRRNRFLPAGWVNHQPVWWFVSQVGRRWQGRGVAFPTTAESRLACTLLACWSEGHDDGWYLITDLPPKWPRQPGTGCGCGSSMVSSSSSRVVGSGRSRG